ncbi:hypothetical protein GNI_162660 [Gregarina niphandrodes]|uniref:Uncharacterized protein n=1 Tax=Gregarina niphandrodes TaxID=110365 RepID=A0A023AYE5_GRENI|nr:hypothetical protein GNI_162660 [Gregarina niphandrodes]EZG43681.1 hypothetical protein GNI_162660 [Gregarina niphandrodes]|eukprot:XP_011133088.1 hypothetical protein GNI_162660 [Gregarina niphandrodes]
MKTSVCGESSGLGLSGVLSVLYTDGGQQTSLEGCSAKVAVIDGLGSQVEVLVVADPKDLAKPRSKFDLTQDSVRLLVLPPQDLDEYLGEDKDVSLFGLENECRHNTKSRSDPEESVAQLETRATDYQRAVDSFATNVWHGLTAPKNPLDALNEHVADQIFQDIMPRTMAPARPVEGARRAFIKEWRSVTREDYDLLWKQHFNPREIKSKTQEAEHADLAALNKTVFRAIAPGKSPRSWSSVLGQRAVEYGGVLLGALAVERLLATLGYLDDVWSGNDFVVKNGSAVAPKAHALRRGLTSAFSCEKLPDVDLSSLYWDHLFRDTASGWDLMTFRTPLDKCRKWASKSYTVDYTAISPELALEYPQAALHCGSSYENATLICRNLGVATPQCFDFISRDGGPRGLELIMGMLGRIFRPSGNEECVVRCHLPQFDRSRDLARYNGELRAHAAKRLPERDQVRKLRRERNITKWIAHDACTPQGLQKFVQSVKQKYPPGSLPYFKQELSSLWFKAPCGSGVWTQGDPFPTCTCPRLSITCSMSDRVRHLYDVTVDFHNETSQHAFDQMTTPRMGMEVMQNMEAKRCLYDCFTQISPD